MPPGFLGGGRALVSNKSSASTPPLLQTSGGVLMPQNDLMEKLAALCKRRGFIFQSSEIYGGIGGFWDYGPLGVELKRNVKEAWWRDMVTSHDDTTTLPGAPRQFEMCGLDCSIIMHPQVWKCSGHYDLFCDMMQTCRQCKKLYRSDQVWEALKESEWVKSLASACSPADTPDLIMVDGPSLINWAKTRGRKVAPGLALVRNPEVTLSSLSEFVQRQPERPLGIIELLKYAATEQMNQTGLQTPCPNCGGDLTEPR